MTPSRRDAHDPDSDDLRDYVRAKQSVVDVVRDAGRLLTGGGSSLPEPCEELLVKLAEDRFNLAVVGQFKRGKSTLMNALIGCELLPTGILPLTSAVTTLCYGPKERIRLRRRGWAMEQEIGRDELADYVTERGNPGNEKGLLEARIELPNRFLRRGLYFVDTPGVGSAHSENTATTYAFLPETDAVVFVTSVEAPLGEIEERFLRDIHEHAARLFVVVNKIDLVHRRERQEVLVYIRSRIEPILGEAPRLYAVSATQALSAAVRHDDETLRDSGLPALESALATYLAHEQGRAFLLNVLDRALGLLATVEPGENRRPSDDGRGASETDPAGPLRVRALALRDHLAGGGSLAVAVAPETAGPDETAAPDLAEAAARSEAGESSASVALRSGTCPICAAQGQAIFGFFAGWQNALASKQSAQKAFTVARGFCPIHTWQFSQLASPQGLSTGYAPLVEATASALRSALDGDEMAVSSTLPGLAPAVEGCAACEVLRATAAREVAGLCERLSSPDGRRAYEAGESVCVPHLALAVAAAPDRQLAEWLVSDQIRRLDELAEDLRSYALKRDALRRGLINAREERAWRRALVALVGERNAAGAPSVQDEL